MTTPLAVDAALLATAPRSVLVAHLLVGAGRADEGAAS
jgi:hypothetical protein